MPSLDQNIHGALTARLVTVTGLPDIAYEGIAYIPVVGTAFVEPTVVVTSERPASMGDDHLVLHEGLFMAVLVYPLDNTGIGSINAMANLVKSKFRASDVQTLNSDTVRFRYAERKPPIYEPDWIRVPIEIGWYLYSQDY